MKTFKFLVIAGLLASVAACSNPMERAMKNGQFPPMPMPQFGEMGNPMMNPNFAKMQQAIANSVVLINTFEVPKGKEAEALAMWQKAREYLKTQDGYLTTELHQNLDPNGKFHFINVARWRSADDFKKATANMRRDLPDNQVAGVAFTPSLFKVVEQDLPFSHHK